MAIEMERSNTDQEVAMQKLMKMLEDMMVAITFAEAGEYDASSSASGPETAEERPLTADTMNA